MNQITKDAVAVPEVAPAPPVLVDHGPVYVPPEVFSAAYSIRLENYKVNTPTKFQVRPLHGRDAARLIQSLATIAGVPASRIDYVYFSCVRGAEEHVDALDPVKFTDRTLLVPVVVPPGRATLRADGQSIQIQMNHVYEFNHERPHALDLEDIESGCAVVMASVLRSCEDRLAMLSPEIPVGAASLNPR